MMLRKKQGEGAHDSRLKTAKKCWKILQIFHQFVFYFLKSIAQDYEEKGDAEYKKTVFNNAVVYYTKGIDMNCKDDELNAVLYKKRAASHFFLGEIIILFDYRFS